MRNKTRKHVLLSIILIIAVFIVIVYFTFNNLLKPTVVTQNNNSILALKIDDSDFVYIVYLQPSQRLVDVYKLSPYYYILKTHRYLLEEGDPYIAVKKLKNYGVIGNNAPLFIMDVSKKILSKSFGNIDDNSLVNKLLNYFQNNSILPVISYFPFKNFYDSIINSSSKKVDKKLQPTLANLYNFLQFTSKMHITFKSLPTLTDAPIEVGEFVKDGNLDSMILKKKWYLKLGQ